MCGICGIVTFDRKPVESVSLKEMMRKMKHRGPDDEGVFIDRKAGFGFVRLSILDLSEKGHQPMFDESGRFMIIHNGEVYNYIEIRDELKSLGYSFSSDTDTEVVLKSYIAWGEDALDRFNGMWAFVVYDRQTQDIFISRDRYGIKPFYYYLDRDRFVFASEIPSILSVLPQKPSPNMQSIFDYLVFNRTDQTEATFFNEIKKLQHGYLIRLKIKDKREKIVIKKWYNLREKVDETGGFGSLNEFRQTFSSAVGLRLRSDVPVGVCLSGGLDSSAIVSVLLTYFDKGDLNTFSAVYENGQYGDESEYIQTFSSQLKEMYYTTPTAQTLYNDLKQFVAAHGEPVPSTSPYAQFKVMELARNNVVVTLDGQGADEELAGYHYFYGLFFKDLLKKLKFISLFSEIIQYLLKHKSFYALQTFGYFLLPESLRVRLRVNEKGYLNEDFVENFADSNTIAGNLYGSKSLKDALLDHFEYKLEHLLKWEDRNSMWFSLESRVPFLDHRLVENILAMDGKAKIRNGMTKAILRESMKDIIPEKIRTRKDKIGFDTPQDEWFRTDAFQQLITGVLRSESFNDRKIINPEIVSDLYHKHVNSKLNIAKEIWKWIHLEFWFRKFID